MHLHLIYILHTHKAWYICTYGEYITCVNKEAYMHFQALERSSSHFIKGGFAKNSGNNWTAIWHIMTTHSKKSHTNELSLTYFKALRSINLFEISTCNNALEFISYSKRSFRFQVANTYLNQIG